MTGRLTVQQVENAFAVVQRVAAGDQQVGHLGVAIELATAITAQFAEEIFQAHVGRDQHAIGPRAAVGVGGHAAVSQPLRVKLTWCAVFDRQRQAAVGIGHHVDVAIEDRQLGVVVELAHIQARRLGC